MGELFGHVSSDFTSYNIHVRQAAKRLLIWSYNIPRQC